MINKGENMANIGYKRLYETDDYQNFETAMEVSLTEGTIYIVQVKGEAILCESTTKPTEGGFLVTIGKPFQYKKESEPLWVKIPARKTADINIAEA